MTEIPKGHGKWHGGKGSAPKDANNKNYADNYDKIFGKKNEETDEFPERARPDGLVWEKNKVKNDGPPMPNGLQRAWERKEKK